MESKHKKILLIPMIVLIIITLIAIVNVILQSTANADTNSGCNHVWKYASISGEGKHKKTCTKCNVSAIIEACKYTDNIIQNGNSKTHTKVCDLCHGGLVQKCSPGAGSKRTKVPTCTTEGEAKVVCSICNGSWIEKIAKLDHTYVDGLCTKCGKNECTHKKADGTSAYRVNGHGWTKGNYETHEISIVCTICGDSKKNGREKHTFTLNMDDQNYACSKCGMACPHNSFVDVDIIKEATCKEKGQKRQQCTICKFYQIVQTPKISKHEYVTKKVAATCTRDGSVSVECKYCGEKDYSKSYTIDALGHDYSRETSRYEKTPSRHARVYKCSRCNDTTTKGSEEHVFINGKDNGNGTHTAQCKICNYIVKQQKHEGGDHSTGGKCKICNAQYQNHTQKKEAFIYNKSATQHTPIYKCSYSGCAETYIGKSENHNKANIKDNGDGTHSWDCSVCEYKTKENHIYKNGVCTVCNAKEKKLLDHTHLYIIKFDENNHWYECTGCGTIAENSKEAHNVLTWKDNGDGTHKGNCKKCNYELKEKHTYQNGSCTACSAKETTTPICVHDYKMNSDGNKHWKQCTKCNDIAVNSVENHKVSTWTDNGDGTHKGNCEKCNYELKEKHTYQNGSCTACSAKETTTPICVHDYKMNSDGNKHWKQCTKCNDIAVNSVENHKISTWTDNGDGTHKGTCTVCSRIITESHTNGTTKKCEKCSYKGTSSNNNDNNENNNSDNNNSGNNNENNNSSNNSSNNGNNSNNSNNNNNNNNNSGNNSSKKNDSVDKTTATGKLPQTGANNAIIMMLITLGLGTTALSANKMIKIKE